MSVPADLMAAVSQLPLHVGAGGLDVGCKPAGIDPNEAYIGRATVALATSLAESDFPVGLILCEARYIPHAEILNGCVFPEAITLLKYATSNPSAFGVRGPARAATPAEAKHYCGHPLATQCRSPHLIMPLRGHAIVDLGTPAAWRTHAAGAGPAFGPEVVMARAESRKQAISERRGAIVSFRFHEDVAIAIVSAYHYLVTDAHRAMETKLLSSLWTSPESMRPAVNRLKLWLKPSIEAARAEMFNPVLLAEEGAPAAPTTRTLH